MTSMYRVYKKSWLTMFVVSLATLLFTLPILYAYDISAFETGIDSLSPLNSLRLGWDWDRQIHTPVFQPIFLLVGFIPMAVFTVVLPLVLLGFLHNKRGRDFHFAFPVSKREMFLANYVAGLGIIFVPAVMASVVFLVVHATSSPATDTVGQVALNLFLPLVGLWAVYTLNSWACTQARSTVESFVLMGAMQVGVLVVVTFAMVLTDELLFGFVLRQAMMIGLASAGFSAALVLLWIREGAYYWPMLLWAVIALASLAHAVYSLKRHQPEHIGKGNPKGISPLLIKLVGVLSVGFGTLIFTSTDGLAHSSLVSQLLTLLLGSAIAFVLVQFVIARRVQLRASLIQYTLFVGAGVAFILVLVTGAFGYSQRVPRVSQIARVYYRNLSLPVPTNFQHHTHVRDWHEQYFDSPELIELFVNMHQAVVNVDGFLHPSNPNLYLHWGNRFHYTLVDGSSFYREFNWVPESIINYHLELMAHPEFVQTFGTPFAVAFEHIVNLNIRTIDGSLFEHLTTHSSPRFMDLNRTQTYALVRAMQADMLAQTPEQLLNPRHSGLFAIFADPWSFFTVTVYPWWSNTLDTLAEFGYVVELQIIPDRAVITTIDQLQLHDEHVRLAGLNSTQRLEHWFEIPWFGIVAGYGDHQAVTDPEQIEYLVFNSVQFAYRPLVDNHQIVLFYRQGERLATRLLVQ